MKKETVSRVRMHYDVRDGVLWVRLSMVMSDGREIVLCNTEVDTSNITVYLEDESGVEVDCGRN